MEIKVKDFIKKAKQYAKKNGRTFSYDAKRGKGSHGKISIGDKATTIKGLNKKIRGGLYNEMCKQLEIDPEELKSF